MQHGFYRYTFAGITGTLSSGMAGTLSPKSTLARNHIAARAALRPLKKVCAIAVRYIARNHIAARAALRHIFSLFFVVLINARNHIAARAALRLLSGGVLCPTCGARNHIAARAALRQPIESIRLNVYDQPETILLRERH